jgi:hypothetical protein
MISLLIAATLFAPTGVEEASKVEVSIEISATSFAARNHSDHDQVLLFRNAGQDLVIARTLPAGADVLWSFPRQALQGVQLEVVSIEASGPRNGGLVALDELFSQAADALWVQHGYERPASSLEFDGLFERIEPQGTMLPKALLDAGPRTLSSYGSTEFNSGTHVPEPTPSPKPEDYGPPELEEAPLPPV